MALVAIIVVIAISLTAACRRSDPVVLDERERVLVDRLQRDGRVSILRYQRRADGSLLVDTRQGSQEISYRIAAPAPGEAAVIERVIEGRLR